MAGNSELQMKLRKRLEALLKLPENQICADCRKRGPRWASANLDSWTPEQVEFMEQWGNARANALYEANIPSHINRPKEGDSVRVIEKFIRDKYEHKRYIADKIPPQVFTTAATTTSVQPSRRAQRFASRSSSEQVPQRSAAEPITKSVESMPFDPTVVEVTTTKQESLLIDFSEENFRNINAKSGDVSDAFAPSTSGGVGVDPFSSGADIPYPVGLTQRDETDSAQSIGFATHPEVSQKSAASADAILSLFNGGGGNGFSNSPGNFAPYPQHNMQSGNYYLKFVASKSLTADVLTKPLVGALFLAHINILMRLEQKKLK